MGQNTLIALDNEFFYVFGAARLSKIFLAEAAHSSELPDLILPASYLQPFIELFFKVGHLVVRVIH